MKAQTQLLAIAALAILSTVPAVASFELALITESGSNSIRRIDPLNRVVLGSFGEANLINPTALALDQANNTVYVLNDFFGGTNKRITALNYNTGAFVNEWEIFGGFLTTGITFRPGFGLYVPTGNGITLFDTNGAVRATFLGGSANSISSVSLSSQYNELYGHDLGGTINVYSNVPTTGTVNISSVMSGLVGQATMIAVNSNTSYGGALTGNSFFRFNHQNFLSQAINLGGTTQPKAIGLAHGNRMYVAGNTGLGGSFIRTFNLQGTQVSNEWVVPDGTGIRSMATVVAPEPGTMIALSAGILALLRRKKSAK